MKERKEVRKNDTNAKGNIKDLVVINTVVVKVPWRGAKAKKKRLKGWQKNEGHCLTLKERGHNVYPFLDEDVPNILEQLLQIKLT